MHKLCFSAKSLLAHFLILTLIAGFLTACGGKSAYIDRGYAPIANAGKDQIVTSGTLVILDGSQSTDDDGDTLSYHWTIIEKPSGSNVLIQDANTVKPSFMPDMDGTYILQLIVNDGVIDSNADQVIIGVGSGVNRPIANAGVDQNITIGSLVQLDGSNSVNTNGGKLSYIWTIKTTPAESIVSLSDVEIFNPSFTPDKVGKYHLELKVSEGSLESLPDEIIINVLPQDTPSIQICVPNSTESKSCVIENGSGSETRTCANDGLAWGDFGNCTVSNCNAGYYKDGNLCVITKVNTEPTAIPQSISVKEDIKTRIILSATDLENDPLAFTVNSQPEHGVLSGQAPNLFYQNNANYSGADSFTFTVSDGQLTSKSAKVSILIITENKAPTVDAGQDIVVQEGGMVTLNATASDPDGEIVKYEWILKGVVSGNDQGIALTQLPLGEYLYTVKVTDDKGLTATDDVKVTITEKESTKLGSLIGKVLDKKGVPIARSKVSLSNGLETVSDQLGNYSFNSLSPVDRLSVTGSYAGFLQNTEITSIQAGQETVQNIILARPQIIKNFQPDEGVTIKEKGLVVELAPGKYTDQQGTPYDGRVELTASYFPVTTEEGREQFPGDLLAERENGEEGDLTSFGIVKLDLTDESGNKIIPPTKDNKIKLSIPADDSLDKPATIPLWYFDEDKGLWIEDGVATYDPVTNTYVTSVDRIATFNLDHFNGQIGSLEVCVEDSQGNKLPAFIFIEAEDGSWRKTSRTSKDGRLRLNRIISPAKVNIFAGSKDGRLGAFSGNPLLINSGQNMIGQCIVINDNKYAPELKIIGKVVDSGGKGRSNVNVKLLGSSPGQSFSSGQFYNIVSAKSESGGRFEYLFSKTSPFAMEAYLLTRKKLSVKAISGAAKGQKNFKLEKDLNTHDIGNLVLVSNQAPIAYAGVDKAIYPGQNFILDATKSYDPDGSINNYIWSLGDTSIATDSRALLTPEELELGPGRHTFVLTVTDDYGLKSTDEVDLIINENIYQPRVCVGLDRYYYEGSDIDIVPEMSFSVVGSIDTFKWTMGNEELSNDKHLRNPRLFNGENVIRLTVTDKDGLTAEDEITLTQENFHDFIAVNAGLDRFYYKGELVSIAPETVFSASGPITSYQWLLGDVVVSNKSRIESSDFPIGTHALKLIVTDKLGHTASDEVIVTIENKPAGLSHVFVNIGLDRSYYLGDSIRIQAEKVFSAGNQINSYKWTLGDKVLSETAILDDPDLAIGMHTITLTVTDDKGHIGSDDIVITIKEKPKSPDTIFVNLGLDRFYYSGDTIRISPEKVYSGDNSITQYQWSEENKEIANDKELVNPDLPVGAHTLTLTITDDKGNTASDEIIVTVEKPKHFIFVNAGLDRDYYAGDVVEISPERVFSADSQIVSYKWSEGDQELSNNSWLSKSDFTVGKHTIKLTVTDKEGNTASDELIVTVSEKPKAPDILLVNVGLDRYFYKGDSIYISPEKIFSPGRTISSYKWSVDNKVISTERSLINPDLSLGANTVIFEVTDNKGNSASDELTLTIIEKPVAPNTIFVNAGLDKYYYKGEIIDISPEKVFVPGRSIKSYSWMLNGEVLGENRRLYNPDLPLGEHTITFTVTDEQGNTGSDNLLVSVANKPSLPDKLFVNAGLDRYYYEDQQIYIEPEKVFSNNTTITSYQWTLGDEVLSNNYRLNTSELLVGSHTVKLTVTDDQNNKASDEIKINISERPNAPESIYVHIGLDRNYYAGDSIYVYPEKVFSVGSNISNYKWTLADKVLSQSYWRSELSLSGTALPPGSYDIKLTVTDAKGLQASDTFKITILDKPQQPQTLKADAGINKQVYLGRQLHLSAKNSYSPDGPLTYKWHEEGDLLNSSSSFNYKPETSGKHIITLTITDELGNTDTDELIVDVIEPQYSVYADAGLDKTIYKGESAYLQRNDSYALFGSLTYEWREGDKLVSTSGYFSYTPDALGDHTLTLAVKDEAGNTDTDEITVHVVDYQNQEVLARAGTNKSAYLDGYVYLGSDGSYTTGGDLSYEWREGDTLLSTSSSFYYHPQTVGEHIISLTVKDGDGNSDSDEVSVNVVERPDALGVFANAGLNKFAYLDSFAYVESQNEYSLSQSLSYEWKEGDKVLGHNYFLHYYPKTAGEHTLSLTVTDQSGNTDTDEVIITGVERPEVKGVFADAGLDKTVYVKGYARLISNNGYSSSQQLSYEWREEGKLLSSSYYYDYYPQKAGEYTITLTVKDDAGNTATDEVKVTAIDRIYAVHADAGPDQSVYQGNTILIRASNNNYSSSGNVNYEWYEGEKILSTGNSFYYQPKTLGDHVITLKIKDSVGNSGTDELVVKVAEPRSYGIYADAGTDQSVYLGSSLTIGQENTSYSLFGALSYEWREGPKILNNKVSFVYKPQTAGEHTITLTVVDDAGNTATDELVVHAVEKKLQDQKVYADAGQDLTTYLGDTVTVGASNTSFSLSGTLKYEWKEGDKILGTGSSLNYQPDSLGKHTIILTVSNEVGNLTDTDEVVVQVVERPRKVLANAGLSQATYLGETVNLKATDSFTLSGTLAYEWREGTKVLGTNANLAYKAEKPGAHLLILTVTDDAGNKDSDEITINVVESACDVELIAYAGLNKTIIVNENLTIKGVAYDPRGIKTYQWLDKDNKVLSNSAVLNYKTDVTGQHTLTFIVTNKQGDSSSDTVVITVIDRDSTKDTVPPVITLNGEKTIRITQGDVYIDAGASAIDDRDGILTASIVTRRPFFNTYQPGTYTFNYSVQDKAGNTASAQRTVIIKTAIGIDTTPPVITLIGANPITVPYRSIYNDPGATVLDDRDGVLGYSFNSDVNTSIPGEYEFTYTARDTAGNTSTKTRKVIVSPDPNATEDTTPPLIRLNGNAVITVLKDSTYKDLGATAVDNVDGEITDKLIIDNPVNTTIIGNYRVIYSATDKAGNEAKKTRLVKVRKEETGPDTTPPVITIKGDNPFIIVLGETFNDPGATALDDRDGNVGVGFRSNVNPNAIGRYTITYLAQDEAGNTATADRIVLIKDPNGNRKPEADAGDDIRVNIGESVTLDASASKDIDGTIESYEWKEGDTILSIESSFSKDDFSQGSHEIILTVTDNEGATATDTVIVKLVDSSDITPPEVSLISPEIAETTTVFNAIDVIGSASDDNLDKWELILKERGAAPTDYLVIATGTSNVNNEKLAILDPTQLLNGQYDLILIATDQNGQKTQENTTVIIDGDFKVGNFTITFEDLSIPTAGIPITITRTYDTRQRHKNLDFGQGWSIGYENIRIQENRTPGFGWLVKTYPGRLGIPKVCVESNTDNIVSVTLSDGKVKKFKAIAEPKCNELIPLKDVKLTFEPMGDNNAAKLEALDNNLGTLYNGSVQDFGNGPLDPTRYKLTTEEGREFTIDQIDGIREIYEPESKNRITITKSGITHSAGPTVNFERDTNNRITKITAPNGKTLTYAYNDEGDLTKFTNRAGETTTFSYLANVNLPHYLEDITDPRGIRVARNEYDDDGRLIAHIDADGNRIEYTHNITGRIETIKDRLGHSTTYAYNERGNILSETNAEGETTTHTYDLNGNELTRSDALGNTTTWTYDDIGNQLTESDPLGNTTSSTYQVFNQFDTQTDALGRKVIDNYYKNYTGGTGVPIAPGPLTQITDAMGNTIIMGYGAGGITRITDVAGNTSRTEYNSAGFVTASIDALGIRTDYTVDALGNRLSATTKYTDKDGVEQTLTTTNVYDNNDNLIQTTDPLGNVTKMVYNAINKLASETDANGNKTTYSYDNNGNKVKTTYADGTTETIVYDAENNKLSETDRLGRTTKYVYDKVNRLVETILPDSTTADDSDNPRLKTEYDKAGRVSAEIDANGNKTSYAYDAAGRRTSVTDANGNTSSYTYDAVGNQTSFTDAKGNKTLYEYDALDRRTKTIFADSTSKSITYDALGRKISQIDQAGISTSYTYDALGRLIKVTDAQGNETSYAYNEQGNKTSQTDAEGRITKWSYDKLGRQISRTLPMGQVETFAYDANGNLVSKTDFNGKTTTYQYDVTNRLVKSTYADGQVDELSYDAVGNRIQAKITDNSGTRTTTYVFDYQNRLTKETQADGTILEYAYDNNGNRTQLKQTKGTEVTTTSYTFDSLNRLSTVTASEGTTTYNYDKVGNRQSVTHSNGNVDSYVYDTLNRLTNLKHQKSDGTVLSSYSYTLDDNGKRTKITEATGRVTDYTYDNLNRLTAETISDTANGNYSASYQYDKVGNRVYETVDGVQTQYTYDNNDRLSQQGGTTYTYDANGNTLTETLDSNTKTYTYNAKNQLVQTDNATASTTYQYNTDGIRIAQTTGLETKQYIIDSNRAYAQVIEERLNNTKVVSYTYGDDLLSQTRNGTINVYHYDGLGSTRALSDSSGAITDSYNYGAFGEVLNQTGITINDYLFAGEQFDANLGQYYLRARYYNQGIGRFTQQDSWMGNSSDPVTLHKYLYGNVDPVNNIDPSGNMTLGDIMSGIGGASRLALSATVNIGRQFIGRTISAGLRVSGRIFSKTALREVKKCIKNRKKCNLRANILIVGKNTPNMLEHIRDAQSTKPHTIALTHKKNKKGNRQWYNKVWYKNNSECATALKPSVFHQCDEYPMFKTIEGGEKNYPFRVSLRWVPMGENQLVGRYFGGLTSAMRRTNTKRFFVITSYSLPTAALPFARKKK